MDTKDNFDYAVPFDEDVLLCYSHSDGSVDFKKHATYGWFMIRINTEKTYQELVETERQKFHEHGVWMWITWTIFAYIMIASRRYLKTHYHLSSGIHIITGTLVLILTLIYAFKAIADLEWKVEEMKAHTFFGFFMLASVVIIAVLGGTQNILAIYW